MQVAVDLRDDWPSALTAAGFDPSAPAAFIAEGLMIYLPAAVQGELFTAIDALAAPGSHVAIEEGEPMPAVAWEAAKAAEAAQGGENSFFQLIYNERFATADDWFGSRGWDAVRTPLADQISKLGRPLPDEGTQAGSMVRSNFLVSAIKRTH